MATGTSSQGLPATRAAAPGSNVGRRPGGGGGARSDRPHHAARQVHAAVIASRCHRHRRRGRRVRPAGAPPGRRSLRSPRGGAGRVAAPGAAERHRRAVLPALAAAVAADTKRLGRPAEPGRRAPARPQRHPRQGSDASRAGPRSGSGCCAPMTRYGPSGRRAAGSSSRWHRICAIDDDVTRIVATATRRSPAWSRDTPRQRYRRGRPAAESPGHAAPAAGGGRVPRRDHSRRHKP